MSLGVDYASIDSNHAPSFAHAFEWGARFAIIRGAFTLNGDPQIDPTLRRDRAAACAAGLQIAPYMILGWHSDVQKQVDNLVEAYGEPARGDLPPALDVEGVSSGMAASEALAKVEAAVIALQAHYKTVMIYTSQTVWSEQLGDAESAVCGACPLWLKVGYPWNARNAPHVDAIPKASVLPRPWRAHGSPGAFLEQFQGDAVDVPGFTSTVDLNLFLAYTPSSSDPRTPWLRDQLNAAGFPTGATDTALASAIRAFQAAHQLTVDGVIGPSSWAALCARSLARGESSASING